MGRQSRPSTARWGPSLLALLVLLVCAIGASAHASQRPPPVKRLHLPERSTLRILPRHVTGPLGLVKRSRIEPPPESLLHDDTLMLTAELPSLLPYNVHLLVSPTENLFGPDAKIVARDADGQVVEESPLRPEDYRFYSGDVIRPMWAERAWEQERVGMARNQDAVIGHAAISVRTVKDGTVKWEGTFDIGGEHYNVLTRENYNAVKTSEDIEVADLDGGMVVFTSKDMAHEKRSNTASMCGSDKLAYNNNPYHPARLRRDIPTHLLPRGDDMNGNRPDTNYIDNIGSTAGCSSEQRILYMGVMLDCNYVSKFHSVAEARSNLLNKWNMVTGLYKKTFSISLGIVELTDMGTTCSPANGDVTQRWNANCDSKLSLDNRLGSFSRWRGARSSDNIGLWHLMTNCQTDTEVGVAWLGALCTKTVTAQDDGTYVSGTGVSSATPTEWNVIAHEIGHGFGAIHDCQAGCTLTGPCCPSSRTSCDAGGQYIMNPTTSPGEQAFSPCTIGNICTFISSNNKAGQCLNSASAPQKFIDLNRCGNGIVEEGEECDPGMNATSQCCDPTTCKFINNAKCDPSNGLCCADNCQFKPAGTVCRASINDVCDTAEVCTGSAAACPDDVTAKDGTSCGADGLTCASGHCTSLDQQCKAAGMSQGLNKACGQKNDKSCVVSCKDPNNANVCQILQAVLIDGSPCGYGGHCYNATCKAGSWQDQFAAMYTQNLQISVPVTVAVGIVILAILYQLLRCCWTRRPSSHPPPRAATNPRGGRPPPPVAPGSYTGRYQPLDENVSAPPAAAPGPHRSSDDNNYYDPNRSAHGMTMNQIYSDPYATSGYGGHDQQPRGYSHPHDNWVDERMYNGPSYGRRN